MRGYRGKPIVTLRLRPEIIAALKICAERHGQTVSDLIRDMIVERLQAENISITSAPLDGQLSM